MKDCCSGKLIGDKKESTKIQFKGNKVIGGTYEADTKTAGYVSSLGKYMVYQYEVNQDFLQLKIVCSVVVFAQKN